MLKIKSQYRIARLSQTFIFGSAFVFWILIFFPFVQLMFPAKYHIVPQEKLGSLFGTYTILIVFIIASILIYGGSFIYASVLPKLRVKEKELSDNFIQNLFPRLRISNHLEINGMTLANSKLFAWFKPFYKMGNQNYSAITTFGVLESRRRGSFFIADIGLVEDNVKNKSKSFLFKIPIINTLLMFYEFGLKRAFSSTLNDQMQYTFRGIFSYIKFNKKLDGLTVVLPDNIESKVGYLAKTFQSLNFKRDEVVYMEDPEFEKEFVVYTNNDIEARYVLTASMMERMTHLKRQFNRPVMFSFTQDTMFIVIESASGIFSWSAKDLKNKKVFEELHNDISCCVQMFDKLKINQKIWG